MPKHNNMQDFIDSVRSYLNENYYSNLALDQSKRADGMSHHIHNNVVGKSKDHKAASLAHKAAQFLHKSAMFSTMNPEKKDYHDMMIAKHKNMQAYHDIHGGSN